MVCVGIDVAKDKHDWALSDLAPCFLIPSRSYVAFLLSPLGYSRLLSLGGFPLMVLL